MCTKSQEKIIWGAIFVITAKAELGYSAKYDKWTMSELCKYAVAAESLYLVRVREHVVPALDGAQP